MKKADCYKCKFRGNVPGSAHSSCEYEGTKTGMLDFFNPQNVEVAKTLNIKGHKTGVMGGWFMWPVDFDPVWLENCNGFEEKK